MPLLLLIIITIIFSIIFFLNIMTLLAHSTYILDAAKPTNFVWLSKALMQPKVYGQETHRWGIACSLGSFIILGFFSFFSKMKIAPYLFFLSHCNSFNIHSSIIIIFRRLCETLHRLIYVVYCLKCKGQSKLNETTGDHLPRTVNTREIKATYSEDTTIYKPNGVAVVLVCKYGPLLIPTK